MYRLKQAFQLSSSLDQDNCLLKDMCVLSCSVVPDSLLPMDCSPLGSSVHWILQERILEWVAISFSRGSLQPRDQIHVFGIGGRFFITEPPGKPTLTLRVVFKNSCLKAMREILMFGKPAACFPCLEPCTFSHHSPLWVDWLGFR